mgnify:CR=1 FL=1
MSVNETEKDESAVERELLSRRLREAREYLNLSQDEVAKRIGIARAAISLIESGQRRVDALELAKFARVYQRPVSYFTSKEGDSEIPTDVAFAARAIHGLSKNDLQEVARFADFLRTRKQMEDTEP